MVKVGSKVYVYPEVTYGIVRAIRRNSYLVEFKTMDSDGTYSAWFYYNDIKPAGR